MPSVTRHYFVPLALALSGSTVAPAKSISRTLLKAFVDDELYKDDFYKDDFYRDDDATTTGAPTLYPTSSPFLASDLILSGVWRQLGGNIDGEAAGDNFGSTVSLNSDGTVLAVGAPYNDGSEHKAGQVRAYSFTASKWAKKGKDINGEAAYDESGRSVSLSSNGAVLAVGAPHNSDSSYESGHVRVFDYAGADWSQIGGDIDGEAEDVQSGRAISLSGDGTVLAIGAPYDSEKGDYSGHVRVYSRSGATWLQLGNDIDGEASYDESGYSVSLNEDGTILAVGAINNDGTGANAGHVRVYDYSNLNWTQLGADIDGEAAVDFFGTSVSLSGDGTVVAIGADFNDGSGTGTGNGTDAGSVRVYYYSGSAWTQLGSDIDGESGGDYFGRSVSLCSNGTIVAIGAPKHSNNGRVNSGHVLVYAFAGSDWVQLGAELVGENAGDEFGSSVSLSSDGSVLAIGAPFGGGGQTDSSAGSVRVFYYDVAGSADDDDIDNSKDDDAASHLYGVDNDNIFYLVILSVLVTITTTTPITTAFSVG